MSTEGRPCVWSAVFGAIHQAVEKGDYMDNILSSQMGCDDDARKPLPVQLTLMKGRTILLLLFSVLIIQRFNFLPLTLFVLFLDR